VAAVRALLNKVPDKPTATVVTEAGETEPTAAEIEAILAQIAAEDAKAKVLAGAGTELSAETMAALEFAQTIDTARSIELAAIRTELDAERYRRESAAYLAAGVPPHMVELARPLLEGAAHVVELSNGKTADAGAIVRSILDECKGTIELGIEYGGRMASGAPTKSEAEEAAAFVELFKAQYGMGATA
jgi:hypothetical protein